MWAAQRKEHRFAAETFLLLLETESAEVLQVYFFLSARGKRLFMASLLDLQVAGFSFCLLQFVFVPRIPLLVSILIILDLIMEDVGMKLGQMVTEDL